VKRRSAKRKNKFRVGHQVEVNEEYILNSVPLDDPWYGDWHNVESGVKVSVVAIKKSRGLYYAKLKLTDGRTIRNGADMFFPVSRLRKIPRN